MTSGSIAKEAPAGSDPIDALSDLIIRPHRAEYTVDDLQQMLSTFNNKPDKKYKRYDLELDSMRGLPIQCSWYKPMMLDERGSHQPVLLPCVIYCHGNCGSRLNASEALQVLENGFSLFTFDFCGCGMSDGEYISLGYYERHDVAAVIEYLGRQDKEVSGIAIWGRSMGAVTAIMYAAKDPSIDCIVCDSPFSSLNELIDDVVADSTKSVSCCIRNPFKRNVVKAIRKSILKRAMFDINDVDTVMYARECKVPTMIIHGDSDDFVFPEHSKRVFKAFKDKCMRKVVQGGHNDQRAEKDYKAIIDFMIQHCSNGAKRKVNQPSGDFDIEGFMKEKGITLGKTFMMIPLQFSKPRLDPVT